MPKMSHGTAIDLQEVNARCHTARDLLAATSLATPSLGGLWRIVDAALSDVPSLIEETARLTAEMVELRRNHADLMAAARATLTAHVDNEEDPLFYLRDELSAHGQLPVDTRRCA